MSSTPAIQADRVSMHFGGVKALDDVSWTLTPGRVQAIIGPNGAGKTTFLNVIAGVYEATAGEIRVDGEIITGLKPHQLARRGVARTFQTPQIFLSMSVVENVLVGAHLFSDQRLLSSVVQSSAFRQHDESLKSSAKALLELIGLSHRQEAMASQLSYGELKRLELARALAQRPKVLLLDEPAAGLNASEKKDKNPALRGIPKREGESFSPLSLGMSMMIDYQKQLLTIGRNLPPTAAVTTKLPMRVSRLAMVRGVLNSNYPAYFVVDTGGEVISISSDTASALPSSAFRRIPLKVWGTSGWDRDAFLLPGQRPRLRPHRVSQLPAGRAQPARPERAPRLPAGRHRRPQVPVQLPRVDGSGAERAAAGEVLSRSA